MAFLFDISLTGHECKTYYINDISNYDPIDYPRAEFFSIAFIKSTTTGNEEFYELDDPDNPKIQFVIEQDDFTAATDTYRAHLFSIPVYDTDPSPVEFPAGYILYDAASDKIYKADNPDAHYGDWGGGDWTDISGADPDDMYDYLRTFIDTVVIDDERVPYEATRNFSRNCTAPSAVTIIEPEDNDVNVSLDPTLSWEEEEDATDYLVFFGPASTGALHVATVNVPYYIPDTLDPNTEYEWYVWPRNYHGTTSTMSEISFTTIADEEVECPDQVNPSDGATNIWVKPSFEITDNATNGVIAFWHIFIYKTSGLVPVTSFTFITPGTYPDTKFEWPSGEPPLDWNTQYTWLAGYSLTGSPETIDMHCDGVDFTTMSDPGDLPDCSDLVSPNNGDEFTLPASVHFDWDAAAGATGYALLIYTDNLGAPGNLISTHGPYTATEVTLSNVQLQITVPGTYWWTIIPYNGDYQPPASICEYFEIEFTEQLAIGCPTYVIPQMLPVLALYEVTIPFDLTWIAGTNNDSIYFVLQKKLSNGTYANILSWTDPTQTPGVQDTYTLDEPYLEYSSEYRIVAVPLDADGREGDQCEIMFITEERPLPECPTVEHDSNPLSAIASNPTQIEYGETIDITFGANTSYVEIYYYPYGSTGDHPVAATLTQSGSWIPPISYSSSMVVYVVAYNDSGTSEDCGVGYITVTPAEGECPAIFKKYACNKYWLFLEEAEDDDSVFLLDLDGTTIETFSWTGAFPELGILIELPDGDGIYMLQYGDICIPVIELCEMNSCFLSLMNTLMCCEEDPCTCDNDEAMYEMNKIMALHSELMMYVEFEKYQYVGMFTCSENKESYVQKINMIWEKLAEVVSRCGDCGGGTSASTADECDEC